MVDRFESIFADMDGRYIHYVVLVRMLLRTKNVTREVSDASKVATAAKRTVSRT